MTGAFTILFSLGSMFALSSFYIGNFRVHNVFAGEDEYENREFEQHSEDKEEIEDKEDSHEEEYKKEESEDESEIDEEDDESYEKEGYISGHIEYEDDEDADEEGFDEDRDDDSDEFDDEDYSAVETVDNADGTITNRYTKIDGNETMIREVNQDANGNKISEKVFEKDMNSNELKLKLYDIYGERISQYELKIKNGSVAKIHYEGGEISGKIRYRVDGKEFVIKDEKGDIKVGLEDEDFRIARNGKLVISSFPMQVDGINGDITIVTPNGNVVLTAMPDVIVDKATEDGNIDILGKVELKERDQLEYEVQGIDYQKLLGIFTVEIPVKLEYNAQTGEIVGRDSGGFFNILLNIFSF